MLRRFTKVSVMHNYVWSALLMGIAALSPVLGQDRLSDTRDLVGKWVETRQIISQTRSDWETTKETLGQTIRLFERELANLAEEMSKVSTNSTQVELERAQALAEQKEIHEALDKVQALAPVLEAKIQSLVPAFPPPLLETITPLLKRIPAADDETKAGGPERMQNIVGIVNEVDKFNASVAVVNEIQKNPAGAEVQVETIYIGLGQAYFVDKSGAYAGVGAPTPQGWKWTPQTELAAAIKNSLAIYRNAAPAVFVGLPARIQ